MFYLDRGSCRCQTLPKILCYSLMTYSEPRSICTFFQNPHSCGSFGFHSLPPFPRTCTTTFPPCSLHVGAISWPLRGSEITLSPLVVLTDWVPSLSTPSACRSISMPFRFHHPASPVLQYVSLLTGIARCTSLGVCGRWRTRTACSS